MATFIPAVRCQSVTKSYPVGDSEVKALRGVDLEVQPGELMMLVGPSGCGKTTLISVVAGILDQDGGQCEVFGRNFLHMPDKEKLNYRARNIGFVFQAYNLLPTLTAAENVAVPLIINRTPRREALAKANEVLAGVGLGERSDSLPSQLSGGEQQRVAIARALAHGPRLVVCDEPTSALDHETGRRVMELLRGVALAGDRTLIIVTHDERIFDFADRIARMDDGRITRVATPGQEREPS
ncbi:MAG TPA: ABC transporter ATP-binding protein [Methylococcaceae bacterium]|nr:ABC transporter ATP-binding protein [Methylococcaceae bacterium]